MRAQPLPCYNSFEIEEELLRHEDVVPVAAYAVPSLPGGGDWTEGEVKIAVFNKEGSELSVRQIWKWGRYRSGADIEVGEGQHGEISVAGLCSDRRGTGQHGEGEGEEVKSEGREWRGV